MEININLPHSFSVNTYKELRNYLKQFELAIHHAQKAVENAEESGVEVSEDTFVTFRHPALEKSLELDAKENKELQGLLDNYYEELQDVVLQISLN